MRRSRSRSSNLKYGCLSSVLILFVQFAPSIHASTPHENRSSCNHTGASLHFESAGEVHSTPCSVCALLSGGQSSLLPISIQIDEIRTVRSSSPFIQASPEACVPDLPDSRGPPLER